MKEITKSKDVIIGEYYLLEELEAMSFHYFKKQPTTIRIDRYDGRHFWTNTFDSDSLTERWSDYTDLCVGCPEEEEYTYYKQPTTK